jgi:AraC-like DNA-binding protein
MTILQFSIPPLPHYLFSGEDTYDINETHPNRRNIEVFDLLVVTKGTLFLGEEENEWSIGSGEALILRPDHHHYSTRPCQDETHFFWLHFQTNGNWKEIDQEGNRKNESTQITPFYKGELFNLNIPRFCKLRNPINTFEKFNKLLLLNSQVNPTSRWEEQLIFQELLQDLYRNQKSRAHAAVVHVAEKAATYLQQNYQDPLLTYKSLKAAINFHPTYVTRCMKQVFGTTPLEYLTKYRIEQSKLLLINTDLPICDIGEKVGFNSPSYFTRCFMKHVNISPLQFRKHYR